ncbi:MAG: thioredoxin family protein [Polyangiaceae bacterium]
MLVCALVSVGCTSKQAPAHHAPSTTTLAATTGKIHWIEDDYARALAQANREKKPLVIDGWATWCTPCVAMRDDVLTDPSIQAIADRFVWLSLDDDHENIRPLELRHHIETLPTFVVVDPSHDAEVARWVGAADPRAFRRFLLSGERWYRIEGNVEMSPLDQLRASAEKNVVFGEPSITPGLFIKLLERAPNNWVSRDEVTTETLRAWIEVNDVSCSKLASQALSNPPSASAMARLDLVESALACIELAGVPTQLRSEVESKAETALRALRAQDDSLSVEDIDAAFVMQRSLALRRGDNDVASSLAKERLDHLDRAAARCRDRKQSSRFDLLRAMAMVDVGQADLAVMMLRNSQAELTDEADPTVRLATLLLHLKRYPEALAEAKDGLAHTRGVRIARLLQIKGDALVALGQAGEAKPVYEEALMRIEALPWAMRADREREKLKAKLEALRALP